MGGESVTTLPLKNNIITEDQQKVIEARTQRTGLEDKDRMTRRRNAMAKMFTQLYERNDDSILLAVQTWESTIAAGEQHFLELLKIVKLKPEKATIIFHIELSQHLCNTTFLLKLHITLVCFVFIFYLYSFPKFDGYI